MLSRCMQTLHTSMQCGNIISRNMFYQALQACISKRDICAGRNVHHLILKCSLKHDAFLRTHLIRMYGICGSLPEAKYAFQHPNPTVYMWNAIISAHTKLGHELQALNLYVQMSQQLVIPDGHLFVSVLQACGGLQDLMYGKYIHGHVLEVSVETNAFVGSALIDMYGICGSIEASRAVFDAFLVRDVVIWSAMISSYAEHHMGAEAFQLFEEMQHCDMKFNHVTLSGLMKVCSNTSDLHQGKLVHTFIIESGVNNVTTVGNNLIHMYGKCRSLEDACAVFGKLSKRDVVTWNALIVVHAEDGQNSKALGLFEQMLLENLQPDGVTYMSILKGCSSEVSLEQGKLIHSLLVQSGIVLDVFIGSILIDMYINFGSLDCARNVFDSVRKRDTAIFSSMIGGYVRFEQGSEAIKLLHQMQHQNVEPDNMTFASIVKACSLIAALDQGKLVHTFINEHGLTSDIVIDNALIDMYSRSGSLRDAASLFCSMEARDLVTWNAVILGYAQHNEFAEVTQHFGQMRRRGVQPNDITFVILLSACCRKGLVRAGFNYFNLMVQEYGIMPLPDHYNCLVDLLGRTGCLLEAEGLLISARLELDIMGWMCLLGHCRLHKDVDLAKRCFNHIGSFDSRNAGAFILMSKIYIDAGMEEEAKMLEQHRVGENVSKTPGKASIEVGRDVHLFIVGDKSRCDSSLINGKLQNLVSKMKDNGYLLQTLCDDG